MNQQYDVNMYDADQSDERIRPGFGFGGFGSGLGFFPGAGFGRPGFGYGGFGRPGFGYGGYGFGFPFLTGLAAGALLTPGPYPYPYYSPYPYSPYGYYY